MSALRLVGALWPEGESEDLLARFRTWMQAQSWSERTVGDRIDLVRRLGQFAQLPPESLQTEHVLSFLSQTTFSATSRQTYYAGLRSWFGWLEAIGARPANPMSNIRKPRAGQRAGRYISTAHLEHLLGTRMHQRTRTMILLMAYQGLRAFEVAKFRGADIDRIGREVEVWGKGDVQAILPLHPVIEVEAQMYGQGWWFPQWTKNASSPAGGHVLGASVSRIVADAMRRAGVPGTGHSLRHWHATELLRSGVDSRVTQELMRHASLATTQRYMHVDDTQRREGLLKLPDVT